MDQKKRSVGASERDEWLRAAWRTLVAGETGIDAERLVFVDEMGTNTSLAPLYGWSRRGRRAYLKTPRNWGKNVTLLASITREGMGPCLAVEGATTKVTFEAYLEHVLAPALSPGRVVVMDNLSAHTRCPQGREGQGDRRGEGLRALVYLPPYSSPDFDPIEQAFRGGQGAHEACRGA
jgi:DDE superfamily endonuclease